MGSRRTRKVVGVLALSMAVVTAGIATGSSTAVAKTSGPPVKLMLITELTAGVTTTELPNGAKAAVKALNKKNGINGSPIKLTVCDTKNDPNTAAACGQTAVDGKYLAVVGTQSTQAGKYFPILQAANIPVVGNNAADAADFLNPDSFPLAGGILATPGGLAQALADAGSKKISVGYINVPQGAIIPTLANMALTRYGLEVQNKVPIDAGSPDLASQVEAVTANGTDGIILAITGQDAINFIQTYISSGKTGAKFALITTDSAAVLKVIKGQDLDFYGSPSYDSRNKQYRADMKAAGYSNPVGNEIVSYAAVMGVAEASKGLATLDGPSLAAKLPTITDLDLGSILPIVDFTKAGTVISLAPRASNVCVKISKLTKTKFEIQSKNFVDAYTGETCTSG